MSLPSGYKRLEYIESSGTQRIDSGVRVPKGANMKIVMDVQFPSQTGVYGGSDWYFQWAPGPDYAIMKGSTTGFPIGNRDIVTIEYKNDIETLYVNGQQAAQQDWSARNYPNYKIGLFCMLTAKDAWFTSNTQIGKKYSYKIYDNDTLIRDYIPCQTASGEIGMWDDVNSVFYGNDGTGTFTAGPVIAIAANESEITKLEYIESSGNQWIDSGIVPGSSDFSVKSKIRTTAATSADNWFVTIGHSKPSGSATFAQFGIWSSKFVIHLTYVVVDGSTAATSNDVTIDFSMSGNTASLSGDASYSVTNANFGSGSFRNQSITICDGHWRTYWSQITVGGTLVRNYIAAKLSDGTVGLYDKLNGLLYINVGSGTFTAGPSSFNLPVNIGGTWKDANEAFVNIGSTWKTVDSAYVNIGGTWKELS